MFLLQESIEKYGILNPLIVRPVPDGYYEIISGHRRKHAAEKLALICIPLYNETLRGCFTVGGKKKYQKNDD